MEIKKVIDDWYYNCLSPAVTIGEINRIKLAKMITEHIKDTSGKKYNARKHEGYYP